MGGAIDVLVSNNRSTDGTEALLDSIRFQHLRIMSRETHYSTAEEHIYETIQHCRGEFVWFLGDDDMPNLTTIRDLPTLLTSGPDFFLFNSKFVDGYAGETEAPFIWMNAERIEAEFSQGALALGFTSTLAGVSNAIYRRATVARTEWRDIVARSIVYSLVAWQFRAFKGARLAFINQPLVTYTVESSAHLGEHFERVAEKLNVGDKHFWCLGLMQLLDLLVSEDAISDHQIRSIWEFDRHAKIHRLIDSTISRFRDQIALGSRRDSVKRNMLSQEDFEYCADWFLRLDPGYFKCIEILRLMQSARDLPEEDRAERVEWTDSDFQNAFIHKMNLSNRWCGFIGEYRGYHLYEHRFAVVAFRIGAALDRVEILRWLDPEPDGENVLTGADTASIRSQIAAKRDREKPHGTSVEV